MASVRRPRPVRGNGRGRNAQATYAEFMRDLLDGTIKATTLRDATEADGQDEITIPQFDDRGNPLEPIVVVVPRKRLVSVEYDDPRGPNGGGPRDPRDDDPPGGGPRDRGNP